MSERGYVSHYISLCQRVFSALNKITFRRHRRWPTLFGEYSRYLNYVCVCIQMHSLDLKSLRMLSLIFGQLISGIRPSDHIKNNTRVQLIWYNNDFFSLGVNLINTVHTNVKKSSNDL